MESYNFDLNGTVDNWYVEVSTSLDYGYFENQKTGTSGGLWFDDGNLVDYDGVTQLPDSVITALVNLGLTVEDEFYNND